MRPQRHCYQRASNNWTYSKVYSEGTLRIGRNDQHHSTLTRPRLPYGGKREAFCLQRTFVLQHPVRCMQQFRSFAAQYALSPLLSMAAPTSDSVADDSSSLTDERRAALAQALPEVLTEHQHSSESGSEVSTFSAWTFRELLAEFMQQTYREIDSLKARIQRLESLLQP